MTKDRKKKPSDARHMVSVGVPLGTVLGVLILGAALQSGAAPDLSTVDTDPPLPPPTFVEQRQRTAAPAAETPPRETPSRPTPSPPARTEPAGKRPEAGDTLSRLGRRAMTDVERLEVGAMEWTSQVGVYCDATRVSSLVERVGDQPDLYVLPVLLDDRPCFRVCWGQYADHDQAKQARGLPSALRGNGTFPQRISSVTQ